MDDSKYTEEEFIKFYDSVDLTKLRPKEISACDSFYDLCITQAAFTEKQAMYMKFILKKYFPDFDSSLNFKKPFRALDNTKTVSIGEEKDFKVYINFKFPYTFLQTFEKELENIYGFKDKSVWDNDNRVRKIDLYRTDFLKILDFVNRYHFIKEQSFSDLESNLEEAINNQDNIVPHSVIEDERIVFKNADGNSIEYFEKNKKNNLSHDSFLAKTMGFPVSLIKKEKNLQEILVSSKNQFFWMKHIDNFFDLVNQIDTKTCVVIDRNEKDKVWLEDFIFQAKEKIPNKKINVCFREEQKFNAWIKENNLGGKTENGDIFIFQHKPPKWIFKEQRKMLFIATTMINPPTNTVTQDFFVSHPCVIHIGEISPTVWRNKKIVEL